MFQWQNGQIPLGTQMSSASSRNVQLIDIPHTILGHHFFQANGVHNRYGYTHSSTVISRQISWSQYSSGLLSDRHQYLAIVHTRHLLVPMGKAFMVIHWHVFHGIGNPFLDEPNPSAKWARLSWPQWLKLRVPQAIIEHVGDVSSLEGKVQRIHDELWWQGLDHRENPTPLRRLGQVNAIFFSVKSVLFLCFQSNYV